MEGEVLDRRREMLELRGKGMNPGEVATTISDKYGIERRSVLQDWSRRGTWLDEVAGLDDLSIVLMESLYNMRRRARDAYYLYMTADNSSAKVGALRLAFDVDKSTIEVVSGIRKDRWMEEMSQKLDVLQESLNIHGRLKQLEEKVNHGDN